MIALRPGPGAAVRPGACPQAPRARKSAATPALLRLQSGAGNRATSALLDAQRAPHRTPTPAVQRVIGPVFSGQPPGWFSVYGQLAEKYNELRSAVDRAWPWEDTTSRRRAALDKLGQLERALYGWFGAQLVPTIATTRADAPMSLLLNRVQQERIDLVGASVRQGDDDPPLAGFGTLDGGEQARARSIWSALIAGRGVRIDGPEQFRVRVLADLARLLETPTGRMLTGALVDAGQAVRITPTTLEHGKFAASPVVSEDEELEPVPAPGSPEAEHYVVLDLTPVTSVQQRKRRLNDIRLRRPDAAGICVIAGDGTRWFRFNRGTPSTLTMPADAVDASLHPSSRLLGAGGEEIIAPTFVNVGHELGHVLRSLHGISGGAGLVAHAFADAPSDMRAEEFFNIDAVENRIREEAGLSRRGGHSNWVGRELLHLHALVEQAREHADGARRVAVGVLRQRLETLIEGCDRLLVPLQRFGKHGGDPRALHAEARLLGQVAAQLDALARPPRTRALVALSRRARLQRFDIDDRRWDDVVAVAHLGATAYELSTARGERLVVKRSGTGRLGYDPSSEGPVQEALAAKAGEIEELGVATARTVLVLTNGAEGQQLLHRLAGLGSPGPELRRDLSAGEAFLVMERAPGERADRAARIILDSSADDRRTMFARLGRLWAFDALINNTDRFVAGNWGNVILGPGASVVGIDQMIGLSATDAGQVFAADQAAQHLRRILDPTRRREWARRTFASITAGMRQAAWFEGPCVLALEHGALDGLIAVAALDPSRLAGLPDELPDFARGVAAEIGLGGAVAMQAAFAKADDDLAMQREAVAAEILEREQLGAAIAADLREPARERVAILSEMYATARALAEEWPVINQNWFGKDAHWQKRALALAPLRDEFDRRFDRSAAALPPRLRRTARAQLEEWRAGLGVVLRTWQALCTPPDSAHDAMQQLVAGVRAAIHAELARPKITERF